MVLQNNISFQSWATMLGLTTLAVLVMLPGLPGGKNVLLMVADDLGNQVFLFVYLI